MDYIENSDYIAAYWKREEGGRFIFACNIYPDEHSARKGAKSLIEKGETGGVLVAKTIAEYKAKAVWEDFS